jgi:hypothetical protein
MTPLDATWHFLNALAVPFGLALLASALVRLLWWRATTHCTLTSLFLWAYPAALIAHLAAWALTGAEGSMAGYGAMIAATAIALWWRAFLSGPR